MFSSISARLRQSTLIAILLYPRPLSPLAHNRLAFLPDVSLLFLSLPACANIEIGVGLTGFGSIFLLLGVLLFGDRALLSLGNLLFLTGITLLIGTQKTVLFFFSRSKIRGSICFFVGIALVLLGYPIIGMLLEAFGVINLFGYVHPFPLPFPPHHCACVCVRIYCTLLFSCLSVSLFSTPLVFFFQ